MPHNRINPSAVSTPRGYSHVVEATGSRLIFISGQVAADATGAIAGEGDLAAQATKVFENLSACLAAAGASFADVTKITTFVVNYQPEHRAVIAEARERHLPADEPPASTLVGVQALARPEFLIEIEATVVV
ncbi:MAG: RidA family protein [Dehalococcoidia bacterium]|nr:RidA family protein [Dehalococcoidia bacterium]